MTGDSMIGAVQHVTALLERIAAALVALDVNELLAAESELGAALAALASVSQAGDRQEARAAVREAQAVLLRCRRLGVSFTSAVRAMDSVNHAPARYDRAGSYVEQSIRSSVLARA